MALAQYMDPVTSPQIGLREGWRNWLSNPDNKAGLLALGAQLLQPIPVGQSFMGQLGQGIGAAGTTIGNRQKLRADMANDAYGRELGAAELGLRSRGLDQAASQNLVENAAKTRALDQADVGLNLQEEDVKTRRYRAEHPTVRAGSTAGRITPRDMANYRKAGQTLYQKYKADVGIGAIPGPLDPEEVFMDHFLKSLNLTPGQISGTDFAAPGDTVAAPPGAPVQNNATARIGGAPTEAQPNIAGAPLPASQKVSANQYILRKPQQWAMIQQLLASPDPQQKAKGQLVLQRLQSMILDPENLVGNALAPR